MINVTLCAYDAPNNMDGPTSWMKRLLPYLRSNGIETRILFIAAHSKPLPAYEYFTAAGFACKLVYWELFNEEKITRILEDLQQHPPDIFIPNYFPEACHAARWAKAAGIPTISILHNDDDFHLALATEFAPVKGEPALDMIVGVSKMITAMVQTAGVHSSTAVKWIPYGAPLPPATTTLDDASPLKLVYAGRMVEPQKRISELAKAFCRVAAEVPGTECVMYGSGRELQLALDVLEQKGKGLPVTYGGPLETAQVQPHFLQNHIFVLLSDFEGIPISLMEAMGCGLVPVCLNIRSGMTELIINGETGFLVNDRGDSFVASIRQLKSDYALWRNMSAAARQKMSSEYSGDVCNRQWLDLLTSMAAEKKATKQVQVPSIKELKKLYYPAVFKRSSNPMPPFVKANMVRLKVWLGRMKRTLLKQHY
jgi:colanic acid/amylovoran biosynthesis glycosyltransferase